MIGISENAVLAFCAALRTDIASAAHSLVSSSPQGLEDCIGPGKRAVRSSDCLELNVDVDIYSIDYPIS